MAKLGKFSLLKTGKIDKVRENFIISYEKYSISRTWLIISDKIKYENLTKLDKNITVKVFSYRKVFFGTLLKNSPKVKPVCEIHFLAPNGH